MDCERDEIVRGLLRSYDEIGGINHIDCQNLPSKRGIAALCEEFFQVLFPGFLDEVAVSSSETEVLTAERVSDVLERLQVEGGRSLQAGAPGSCAKRCAMDARKIACTMMRELPKVRRLLCTDVEAAYDGDPAAKSFEEIILSYPSIEAVAIQRVAHVLYREGLPLIPRMMTEWAHGRTGIDIHPGAQIGSHFFIDHGTGVVIGETCVIGTRVKLYHGVTLGARSFPKDEQGHPVKGIKRHPNVEDEVTIYPNATVLGGETTIGARSTVGGNVFLMESVPPDTLVALKSDDRNYRVLNKNKTRVIAEQTGVPA